IDRSKDIDVFSHRNDRQVGQFDAATRTRPRRAYVGTETFTKSIHDFCRTKVGGDDFEVKLAAEVLLRAGVFTHPGLEVAGRQVSPDEAPETSVEQVAGRRHTAIGSTRPLERPSVSETGRIGHRTRRRMPTRTSPTKGSVKRAGVGGSGAALHPELSVGGG